MVILFFIAAVLVTALLERQDRKLRKEMTREYTRLKIPIPEPGPGVPMLESWLTVYVGGLLILVGIVATVAALQSIGVLSAITGTELKVSTNLYEVLILLVGGGAALLFLGLRAVKANRKTRLTELE
jgi:hypothetical protein